MNIQRYTNRKLYLVDESRYTTLAEIGAKVVAGAPIHVKAKNTGRDITALVLLQAMVAQESKSEGVLYAAGVLAVLMRTSHGVPAMGLPAVPAKVG